MRIVTQWIFIAGIISACTTADKVLEPNSDFQSTNDPRTYPVYYAHSEIQIDGLISEEEWGRVTYSEYFVDIQGDSMPVPLYKTRFKMQWDSSRIYFAAILEEPHIWGDITERDKTIYHNNDFEIFIDPDRDTHNYYEFEMNALNTVWDLKLEKPYRNRGKYNTGWNIEGLQSGTKIYGTLNNGDDIDSCWTLEVAMDWTSLMEYFDGKKFPDIGEIWKLNFSRVNWKHTWNGEKYERLKDDKGKLFPEFNWVWSPTGKIDMHMPEKWGLIQFRAVTLETEKPLPDQQEKVFMELREWYHLQYSFKKKNGRFSQRIEDIKSEKMNVTEITIESDGTFFKMSLPFKDRRAYIEDNSRVYIK